MGSWSFSSSMHGSMLCSLLLHSSLFRSSMLSIRGTGMQTCQCMYQGETKHPQLCEHCPDADVIVACP